MQARKLVLRKILSITAYITIAFAVAFLIADRHPPTLAVGRDAPIDEKIVRLNNIPTTFRKMLGKPMVINFWAVWCNSCLKELPTLSKVSERFKDQVIFVGAALNSDINVVLGYQKRFVLNYEMIAINDALADLWQARALPTTYIVDTSGKIVWAKAGMVSELELTMAIQKLLL